MKIAILIMSTNVEPSVRNVSAMKETFVRHAVDKMKNNEYKNEFDFYFYQSINQEEPTGVTQCEISDHVYNLNIMGIPESIYTTYEKTYMVYNHFAPKEYDRFVRINISMYLNMDLLDAVISRMDADSVYCNALNTYVNLESGYLNDIYPRGDMYIISDNTRIGIIEHGADLVDCDKSLRNRIDIPHVDDTLTGIALIKFFGPKYCDRYKMLKYGFIPATSISEELGMVDNKIIGYRVKTVPPGMNSGYSWDDNEYRLRDGEKMRQLQEIYDRKKINWGMFLESDILAPKNAMRPTLFVQAMNANINDIKNYIKERNNQKTK